MFSASVSPPRRPTPKLAALSHEIIGELHDKSVEDIVFGLTSKFFDEFLGFAGLDKSTKSGY